MKKNRAAWDERFGWMWYGSDVVYNWTDEDFDRAAKSFADAHFTTVILFGTHFRFSYWAYWEDIENAIAKITKAFHKYGIKVVEHHSSHLTYRIDDEAEWDSFAVKRHDDARFPKFRETSQANPILGGAHMDDFAQIDGSTGGLALSAYVHTDGKDADWIYKHYNGDAHCFNHPAFYKAYTEHLERIIKKANIDGIMNDDVQWFGGGHACACEYCRELFHKETGYTLPDPENWASFYENYDDPAYIAWKRFKKKSSGEFHRKLDAFYQSLGFRPMRPAYCAEVLPFDTTCYGFESALDLWDVIFQEACGLIKYSYLCFAIEATNRYALAERHGVPSMALFYPHTPDSAYFAWALSRSWGGLYTGTPGKNIFYDKPYREFEMEHANLYREPKKVSDLAFYFSKETRDYSSPNAPKEYMKPFMSYMEAAQVSGLLSDMVFAEDPVEEYKKHAVLILPYIVMVSDDELSKLRQYVESGGKLIIIGEFATKKPDISKRDQNDAAKALGLSAVLDKKPYAGRSDLKYGGRELTFNKTVSKAQIVKGSAEPILFGEGGQVLGVSEKIGMGEVVWIPCDIGENAFQPQIWPSAHPDGAYYPGSLVKRIREAGGRLLNALVEKKALSVSNIDVCGSLFKVEEGYVVHLVNTTGILPEDEGYVTRTDKVLPFSEEGEKLGQLLLNVQVEDLGTVEEIKLYSPEFSGERTAKFSQAGGNVSIEIPEGLFSGYLLVHLIGGK